MKLAQPGARHWGAGKRARESSSASRGQFEIKIDGVVRTHCVFRETAIEAARFLQQHNAAAQILIADLRDGSEVPFARA